MTGDRCRARLSVSCFFNMRTHYVEADYVESMHGRVYHCEHPVYDTCTLYFNNGVGFAVVQQRFDPATKHAWWGSIDPGIANDIYTAKGFLDFFNEHARKDKNRVFPTFPLRKVMWALRLPPLERQPWETDFNRKMV